MVDAEQRLKIVPFDPDTHSRDSFSCGVSAVDNFFKKTANKLAKANNLRVYVLANDANDVIGFSALNVHSVDYTDLPANFARTRPSHGSIPAAYISMIGVDQLYSGHGYGGDLLIDALIRIARAADEVGIAVVMLDVLDCGDPILVERHKALYLRYGFTALPSQPLRLFLPLGVVRQLAIAASD